jgi:hypothetical protein
LKKHNKHCCLRIFSFLFNDVQEPLRPRVFFLAKAGTGAAKKSRELIPTFAHLGDGFNIAPKGLPVNRS